MHVVEVCEKILGTPVFCFKKMTESGVPGVSLKESYLVFQVIFLVPNVFFKSRGRIVEVLVVYFWKYVKNFESHIVG